MVAHANDDLTSQGYTISLDRMDPLGGSSNAVGGVSALTKLMGSVSNILLFLIALIAGISFIVAGYFYIFSAGDSEKASRAKTIIKWNIVAIVVAFLSYQIVAIVASFFNS